MGNIYEDYQQRLKALSEPKYREFATSLIPNTDNLLGVRIPTIRKLAKELAASDWKDYFSLNSNTYFEETMLQGLTIGFLKEDIESVLDEVKKFVPLISNWSLCDSFCGGLKITVKNKERVWGFLSDYIHSDKPYDIRFAVVMMLNYYIDEEHIDDILIFFDKVNNEDYYVKMAVAWALSMCYVKLPEKTLTYLKCNSLDDFTYNKSLQKICESLKPSLEEKKLIKSMRRSTKNKC